MKKLIIWLLLLVSSFTADAQLIGGGPRKPKGSGSTVDLSGYAVKAATNLFSGSNTFSRTVNYNAPWADYQSSFGSTNQAGRIQFMRGSDGLQGMRIGFSEASAVTAEMIANNNLDITAGGSATIAQTSNTGAITLNASGGSSFVNIVASGTTAGQIRMRTGATEGFRMFTNGNTRFGSSGVDNGGKIQVEGSVIAEGNVTAPNLIYQGGNSYGGHLRIGTNDNNGIQFLANGFHVGQINTGGVFGGSGFANLASASNSLVHTSSTGTAITRNVADANVALIVNQVNVGSTGNIQQWSFNGLEVANVNIGGLFKGDGFANLNTVNNSRVNTGSLGTVISRNVSDGNPALIVDQNSSGSTGHILLLRSNGVARSLFRPDGSLFVKTTTNAGFGLDVNDNARIVGSLTINDATIAKSTLGNWFIGGSQLQFTNAGSIESLGGGRFAADVVAGGTSPSTSSAIFEARATTKGMLIPRMTELQKLAIASPVTSLLVYQNDGTPGFYFWDGGAWKRLAVAP